MSNWDVLPSMDGSVPMVMPAVRDRSLYPVRLNSCQLTLPAVWCLILRPQQPGGHGGDHRSGAGGRAPLVGPDGGPPPRPAPSSDAAFVIPGSAMGFQPQGMNMPMVVSA